MSTTKGLTKLFLKFTGNILGHSHVQPTQDLLLSIIAPDSLQALFVVLERLPDIVPIAQSIKIKTPQISTQTLPELDTARLLLDHEPKYRVLAKENQVLQNMFWQEGKSRDKQFEGILGDAPYYSCIGHKSSKESERYDNLLAQVMLATHTICTRNATDVIKLEEAYRGVRFLSTPNYISQLSLLPTETISQESFTKAICSIGVGDRLIAASEIFQKALIGFRSKASPSSTKTPSTSQGDTDDEFDQFFELPKSIKAEEQEEADLYEEHGGTTDQEDPRDAIAVPATNEPVLDKPTKRELAYQGRQASNRRALNNQLSEYAWNELNQYDLSILIEYLTTDHNIEGLPENAERIIKACLSIMFWTSSSFERSLFLKFFPNSPKNVKATEGLYWDDPRGPFVSLHSPGPQLKRDSYNKPKKAIKVVQHSNIPLSNLFCSTLTANAPHLLTDSKQASLEDDISSEYSAEDLKSFTKRALSQLNHVYKCRLSLGRISHYLENSLARETSEDLPSSMLFFGYHEDQTVTRIHYTLAPARRMEKSYRFLCRDIMVGINTPVSFPAKGYVNDEVYLGTPFSPGVDEIKKLVIAQQEKVNAIRPTNNEIANIIEFHNRYAIYTASFIAFATGYRAIKDPSFLCSEMDTNSNLAIISDKDNDSHYNTRLVWIPDPCMEQIQNYGRHIMALYNHLGLQCSPIFDLIKQNDYLSQPLKLIYLHDLNNAEPLRPGLMRDKLRSLYKYDLPVNANRHYLKGKLLESGCSPEIIEAFLGHWQNGEEPWTCLSGLHPLDFKEELREHLLPIIQRDGWSPIQGFKP